MTSRKGRQDRASPWTNAVLMVASIVVSVAVTEEIVRSIDGQPLLVFPMPEPIGLAAVAPQELDSIPRAAGVERAWFFSDPPPLPNRREPSAEWRVQYHRLEEAFTGRTEFRPIDAFKAWNTAFIRSQCWRSFFSAAPEQIFGYDPRDGVDSPPYRFPPNTVLPDDLVTNQIGWRGRPIEVPRPPRTVRIVFVGASTTIDAHHYPFSHPEFFGHWLDLWAAAKHPDVHFETLNAGRESNVSLDIANVVRSEVLPLNPDLVVYYEGANEFRPDSIIPKVPGGSAKRPTIEQANLSPPWLRQAARYSELLARVQGAIGLANSDLDGREWTKPDYQVVWPPELDENDPDLAYPDLPVNLSAILHALDRIRADLTGAGSDFALSSYAWMVKDGLVLDPVRHKYILEQLNIANYPFRYRELERLVRFQNRVFAKYAAVHGLPFDNVAGLMPFDPDLFVDAIHGTYAGVRLHGWIDFQQLLPVIEKHLADGSWPKSSRPEHPLPTFVPRRVSSRCSGGQ